MSIKSALFAAITTVVLILALGNEWMIDRLTDGSFAFQTRFSITAQLDFAFWDQPSEIKTGTVVRLVLLVILAGVFGGIVGRARPAAAFVGGWAAFLAASVVSAGVFGLVVDERFLNRPGAGNIDAFTGTAAFGTAAGMWLGWLVGLAVMVGSFGRGQPKPDPGRTAPPPRDWSSSPPPAAFDAPATPYQRGGYGAPGTPAPPDPAAPYAPAPHDPGPPPASPDPGGPVIGTPPDRTQVYGDPNGS